MHILFLFVDGIGLGTEGASNPFAQTRFPGLERLSAGRRWLHGADPVCEERRLFRPIDPCLDMDGLPQSGTGQATLFTGINCAGVAGKHYGPYPHSSSRPIIAEHNIFRRIEQIEPADPEPAAFANAYPNRFFSYMQKTDRWTVTTRCCLESSVRIRGPEDLAAGRAVPADITGSTWPERVDKGMMPGDERSAAQRLHRIASDHRLTLFEYYLTDKAGHRQSAEWADSVLRSLSAVVDELLDLMNPEEMLLLLTSDHGNLEDLSTKTHTRNAVPFAAYGAGAHRLDDVARLEDVTPAIVSLLATHKLQPSKSN